MSRFWVSVAVTMALGTVAACNALTGVDDLVLGGAGGEGGSDSAAGNGVTGAGNGVTGAGVGGATTGASSGVTGSSSSATTGTGPPPPTLVEAAETLNRTYDRVMIGQDGSLKWIAPIQMKTPPMAETTQVVLESPAGDQTVDGQLYRYDHLPGGVLFWPQTGATYNAMRVQLDGKLSRIAR